MKLKKFIKNKKQKKVMIGSIIGVVLLLGGLILYKTFALYEEKKEFNVLKGRVGDFSKNSKDIEIAAIVDGKVSDTLPNKEEGYIVEDVTCTNDAVANWNHEDWSITIKKLTTSGTTCSVSFVNQNNFSMYLLNQYNNGEETLKKFEHDKTEQTPALTDYRYVGENPNNYIYFGCDDTCTEDNLYRIIGVMPTQSNEKGIYQNRVKLIKANFYIENESGYLTNSTIYSILPGYDWNHNKINKWEESTLNLEVLNKVFWNSLEEYQKYIATSVWYLGAVDWEKDRYDMTVLNHYNNERSNIAGSSNGKINYITNIGLLYGSDYGYSFGVEDLKIDIGEHKESWLYINNSNEHEWLLSSSNTNENQTLQINNVGNINRGHCGIATDIFQIRPTFYLTHYVQYKNGNGTIENPYRITIN